MKKKVGDYEIGEILGEGSFGIVKKAVHSKTKETVAIKIIDKEKVKKDSMIENLKKEVSILMVVDHPNIVNLKEVLASKTKIYLVLEYVPGGELWQLISKSNCKFSLKKFQNKRQNYQKVMLENISDKL